jgi:molybdenum cofactor cytidylyltransferase
MPAGAGRRTRSLARGLGIGRRGVHAFAGAGGKTSAIRQLLAERPRALATTTTHLAATGFGRGLLAVAADRGTLARVQPLLLASRPVTLALGGAGTRLRSPGLHWHRALARDHPTDLLLVEADGARRRCVKLPAAGEPAWPPGPLSSAIIVVGLGGLGRPLEEVAHHPERFGPRRGRELELAHVIRMLRAYIEQSPPRAPLVFLFTGAGAVERARLLQLLRSCERLVRRRDPRRHDPNVPLRVVATDDLEAGPHEFWDLGSGTRRGVPRLPGVCGVVLAAGFGRRYERAAPAGAKLLVRWRGATLVEHAVRRWAAARPAELVVVTGNAARAVEPRVRAASRNSGTRVRIVRNPRAARGLGSSVRTAARAARPGMALLFGHADMPALRLETLLRIADVGSTLRHCIVVPTVRGAPRNPVFFPPDLRDALARVPDRSGGRAVIVAHPERVLHLDMGRGDDLFDVDRPQDLPSLNAAQRLGRKVGRGRAVRRNRGRGIVR